MAKDKLSEYDATAANNTVVGDVNLAENSCLPSDVNNAIREVMSHQKEAFGSATPLFVDQTNNRLGIGTTAPAHNVEIVATAAGSVNDSLQIRNNATSSGTGSRIRFINSTDNTSDTNGASISSVRNGDDNDLVFETENTERVRIDHAGVAVFSHSVGIGTSIPDSSLTIATSSSGEFNALSIRQANNTSGNESRITFTRTTDAGSDREVVAIVADRVGGNDTDLVFETNTDGSDGATERLRIGHSGDVYIGKTSEAMATAGSQFRSSGQALDITRDGGSPLNINRLSSSGELVGFFQDTAQFGQITCFTTGGTDYLQVGSSGSNKAGVVFENQRMYPTINASASSGTVDLGTSSVNFKRGYFTSTVFAAGIGGVGDEDTYINFANNNIMQFITGGSEKARISSNVTPKFFVGCTVNPSSSVPGSMVSTTAAGSFTSFSSGTGAATHGVFGNANGAVGTIQTSGSSTSYNTSSDRRLKYNIEDASSASDKIDAIQVRQFDWKADDIHQDYGLIAQELEVIEPLAVTGDADSDKMMGIDNSKLVPMLIKEIQELRSRVAALEAS